MQERIGSRGGICGARIYRGLPEITCVLRSRLVGRSFEESHRLRAQSRKRTTNKPLGAEWRGDSGKKRNRTLQCLSVILHAGRYIRGCIAGSVFALLKEALLCT